MYKEKLKIAALALLVAGTAVACGEKTEPETALDYEGIAPSSIEDVVDVFELKYGETKEWRYKDQVFKFSITDIEDNLSDCLAYDSGPKQDNTLQATLRLETDKKKYLLRIKTSPCFWRFYENDGTDIQSVWDLLASLTSKTEDSPSSFQWDFSQNFGKGNALPDSSLSIFIAKVHPCMITCDYTVEKSMYKFLFTVTTNKL